ncbi:hypothetical protein GCM10020358_43660 [Amorphoplanes nipponensis]|uniref:hypothetical protein n=1 Tax=Actinoplanes nipponensis TaxID=135950 RepID=UPI0031EE42D2
MQPEPRPAPRRRSRADLYVAGAWPPWSCSSWPGTSPASRPDGRRREGTYLAQAWAVQHGQGLAHYTYWYDHPPLAWIQLAGLAWLPTRALAPEMIAVAAGGIAMLPVVGASLILVYVISRRLEMSAGPPRWPC